MNTMEALRKLGIMRSGAGAATYKGEKERPSEFMMDGVFDAKKDLISSDANKGGSTSSKTDTSLKTKKIRRKWHKPVGITIGGLVALVAVLAIFGSPSAESVFSDSLDKMLQTDSMVVTHEITGQGNELESVKMTSTSYIEMNQKETKDLRAKGSFDVDLTTQGIPVKAKARYIAINGDRYVKFSELSSTQPNTGAAFSQIEAKINGKWIKARTGDDFANFSDIATDALTTVTALPYANLQSDVRKEIVDILHDKSAFTIKESAQVTVEGQSAYRYELEYDREKQAEVSRKLNEAIGYFQANKEGDEDEIDKLEVWINMNTKQFIKMEYSGSSKEGSVAAVITFSEYGKIQTIEKPNEYFVESELVQ